jgi:exonuclease SbcD
VIRIAAISDSHIDEKATAGGKLVLGSDGRSIRAVDRERCLKRAIDGAIERKVDLIIHAGDLFERPKPTPAEYVIAEEALDMTVGICPVVTCGCNHGMSQSPTEQHALAPLAGRSEKVWVVLRPDLLLVETKRGKLQVAVLPFPQKSLLLAKEEYAGLSPEAVNQVIGEKLAAIIRSFRARLDPSMPSVLVSHVLIREALFGSDRSPDASQLSMSAQDFEGFDVVIVGDIHRHQIVGERLVIPGSTDRMDFGEEHEAKGWCCIELDGPGVVPRVELVETPARRYLTYRDIAEAKAESFQLSDLATDLIIRIKARVSQEDYDALGPDLARWRQYPLFQEEIEVTRQTTARSEAMTGALSAEAAIAEWHRANNRPEDLGELLVEHRKLVGTMK